MANPVGRPTKYNSEVQRQADYYVFNWGEDPINDVVPSRVGLCCWLGINKDTSYEWAAIHPEFSDTLRNIETLQERVAVNGGISGVFNSTITKLVLANHGYSERQEFDHSSKDGTMTPKGIDASNLSDSALAELMNARASNKSE